MVRIHFYGCVIFLCVCVHHISLSIHTPIGHLGYFHVICCCSIAQLCSTLCDPVDCSIPAFLVFSYLQSSLKLMFTESVMPSNHLILYRSLLLPLSIFSSIRVFSNESVLHIRWPKYWSFSFNISPSMNIQDWFPLGWTGWVSLQPKGGSRVFSNTTVQKHQFFSTQLSL